MVIIDEFGYPLEPGRSRNYANIKIHRVKKVVVKRSRRVKTLKPNGTKKHVEHLKALFERVKDDLKEEDAQEILEQKNISKS